MDYTKFIRIDSTTKKVIHTTRVETWRVLNENKEIDCRLFIDYLKFTIPDSTNDIWICAEDEKINKTCAIGNTYSESLGACIPTKPFDSWIFDEDTLEWHPPTPKPEGNYEVDPPYDYLWDEETTSWVKGN